MQQHGHPGQRVLHPEPAPGLLGDPGQRPALIGIPARCRARVQHRLELGDLGGAELALRAGRPLGGQRLPAARRQRPAPPVRAHPRDPEVLRDLPVTGPGLDHLRSSQPHPLPAGPLRRVQATAIGIPHTSGIARQQQDDQAR